tara:strand:- start:133 stop:2142 length:2010 start_codon:yes stop_codon:yes gene_type:complete
MAIRKTFFLVTLLFSYLIQAENLGSDSNSSVEILSKEIVKISDDEYLIGVKFKFDQGWHTYWINPGDSGEKAKFDWNLPEGYKISNPKWPAPSTIPYPPLMTYGYENEVIILFSLYKEIGSVKKGEITLNSEWLACADICLPQSGTTKINLNEIVLSNFKTESKILKVKNNLPKKYPYLISASLKDNELNLSGQMNEKFKDSEIYFFPYDQNLISHTAIQNSEIGKNSFTHKVLRSNQKILSPNIKGVISFKSDDEINSFYFSSNNVSSENKFSSLNLLIALFSAFIGGLLLNLMPCVFPVISLKIFNFIEIANNKREVLFHGMSFSIGSIVTFISIGLIILILKIFGEEIGWGFQLQSPIFVSLLIYLFALLFLNFIGLFKIPNFFGKFGTKTSDTNSYKSSFGTGVLAVAVATPCTAPFMGSALGLALTQPNFFSILIFLFLGIGFSLPYLIISLFPGTLSYLPKPGNWMETFRQIMAIPIFLTILWLIWILSNQISFINLMSVMLGVSFILLLCFIKEIVTFLKVSSKFNIPTSAILLIFSLYLLPFNSEIDNLSKSDISLEKIENLSKKGPLFINFTADWCITCKVNEQIALSGNDFKSMIAGQNINYLKIDWTNKDPNVNKLIETYGRSGIPLYVFYPYEEYGPVILPEVLNKSILEKYLRENY